MDIKIQGVPQFTIEITIPQIDVLIKMARRHYDMTCREAGAAGHGPQGFLVQWHRIISSYKEWPCEGVTPYIQASFRELDTCLKIMEYTPTLSDEDHVIRDQLTLWFHRALRLSNKMYDRWATVSYASPTDETREIAGFEAEAFYDGSSKEPTLMWTFDGYKPGLDDVVLYKPK